MPIKHTQPQRGFVCFETHSDSKIEHYKTFWKKSNTDFLIICNIKGQSIKMDCISLSQIKYKLQRNTFLAHFSQHYFSTNLGNGLFFFFISTNEPKYRVQTKSFYTEQCYQKYRIMGIGIFSAKRTLLQNWGVINDP